MKTYSQKNGFTLVELLVVVALISIILGISSALFTHWEAKLLLEKTTVEIVTAIKVARAFSAQEKTNAQVYFDTKEHWIECRGSKIKKIWHCEDLNNANPVGVSLTRGKFGQGFQFSGDKSALELGKLLHSLPHGFSLSFWVYPEARGPQNLCDIQSLYQLQFLDTGLCLLTPQAKIQLGDLPLFRWSEIQIINNEKSIVVAVDQFFFPPIFWNKKLQDLENHPMILGNFFYGKIDEIKFCLLTPLETIVLPEQIKIVQAPLVLQYDFYGNLDPFLHLGAESIVLEGKKERSKIFISSSGDVVWKKIP